MFHKLRRQFVMTTMAIVSLVLVISFTAIYLSAMTNFERKAPPHFSAGMARLNQLDDETRRVIELQRQEIASTSLRSLFYTLVVAGVLTLIAVYFVSRYIAERAIGVIEEAYTKQRQFIADASHELKTPITIIGTNVDAALSDTKRPSKWLGHIKDETQRMGNVVNDLLTLAKLEDDVALLDIARVDAGKVTRSVISEFRMIAEKKNIVLTITIPSSLCVYR